ncbi:MAG TPA: hypothetical protein VK699_21700, partial [Terriglobales bacterium]|nr:hypothetical protein [Terriglobales bacterium]
FSMRPSTLGVPAEFMVPNFPDCTDQADTSTVDLPIGINATICNYGTIPYFGDTFAGHINWFPITIEGSAGWGDHGADDDYTFTYTSDGQDNPLSVNGRSGLHVEFDSDETIDNFSSDEWNAFHHAVDNDKTEAEKLFDGHTTMGGYTILTGMFGLDGEHNLKAELHPLYALATRRDNFENDPSDEVWLMFARNYGDEGYCSSQFWDSGLEDYTFRLPWREGMNFVDVNWDKTQFVGTDGTSGPTVSVIQPPMPFAGVYVSFHLGPPVHNSYIFEPGASVPFINGALHLSWKGQPVATPVRPVLPGIIAGSVSRPAISTPLRAVIVGSEGGEANETDEVEQKIRAAINQLPPAQQQQVQKARIIEGTRAAVVHRLPPTGPVRKITAPPVSLRIARLHAINGGPALRKAARDAAQMRALCAATHNAPAGLPAAVCTPNVRDHR